MVPLFLVNRHWAFLKHVPPGLLNPYDDSNSFSLYRIDKEDFDDIDNARGSFHLVNYMLTPDLCSEEEWECSSKFPRLDMDELTYACFLVGPSRSGSNFQRKYSSYKAYRVYRRLARMFNLVENSKTGAPLNGQELENLVHIAFAAASRRGQLKRLSFVDFLGWFLGELRNAPASKIEMTFSSEFDRV